VCRPSGGQQGERARSAGAVSGLPHAARQRVAAAADGAEKSMSYSVNTTNSSVTASQRARA